MLAAIAGGTIPNVKAGSLVKILHAQGGLQSLFWCFNSPESEMLSLASAMGSDQPIYGMYSGGGQFPDQRDLPAIAGHYVREIMEIQPHGPLAIGGNCRGAHVAFKVATRLQELGRTVSHLCLVEQFDKSLYGYRGKLLLMYGTKSNLQLQKELRWGSRGWSLPFAVPPRVEWIRGHHGKFFTPANVQSLSNHIGSFLKGENKDTRFTARIKELALIMVHRLPWIFSFYARHAR
jgi:hypothetical protein